MNSARAELLHLLVNAALQPICSAAHSRLEQKNAGMKAGVGIILQKEPLFFEEYATCPGNFGLMSAVKKAG